MLNYHTKWTLFLLSISLYLAYSTYTSPLYTNISDLIKSKTNAYVNLKGSYLYEKRRKVKNGLCRYIYPDLLVAPKSTEDVSQIIRIARHYQVPISVRSGGHSFLCQSIKPGNIRTYSCRQVLIKL